MPALPCDGYLAEGTLDVHSGRDGMQFFPAGTRVRVQFENGPWYTCETRTQPTVSLRVPKRYVRLVESVIPAKPPDPVDNSLYHRVRDLLGAYLYKWAFLVGPDGSTCEVYHPSHVGLAAHLLSGRRLNCQVVYVDKSGQAAKARGAASASGLAAVEEVKRREEAMRSKKP